MNTNRDCGCKSFRSCKICEDKFGIDRDLTAERRLKQLDKCYDYDKETGALMLDQVKVGDCKLNGVKLIEDFITEAEEEKLVADLDTLPWDSSVSGRRKQNFGPRANFKGRKAKCGNFCGFPICTEFIQSRFDSVPRLEGYRTVEQCSIEYTPATGASIEPHIDDCWIWGERIVQLNLLSDAVLTFFPYNIMDAKKYNLSDLKGFPKILNDSGDEVLFNPFRSKDENTKEPYSFGSNAAKCKLKTPQ